MPIYPFRPRFLTPPTERTETDNTTIQSSTNLSKFWDMRCAEILDEDTVFDRSAYGFFAPPRLVSQLIPQLIYKCFFDLSTPWSSARPQLCPALRQAWAFDGGFGERLFGKRNLAFD